MHNKTIGYVNNARFYFCDDENLKKIPKDFSYDYLLLNNDKSVKNALKIADTCDSCIAIRKEILLKNAECIKNLNVYAVDSALYLFALDSNFALYNSKLKLTKYRIHESTSHQLANNSKELWFSISKHMAFVRRQLKELTLIHRCLVTDPSKKLAELKIAFAKMVLSFYSGNRLAFIKDLMAYTRLLKKEGLSIDKRLYLLLFAYVIWPALTIEMYYSASYRI